VKNVQTVENVMSIICTTSIFTTSIFHREVFYDEHFHTSIFTTGRAMSSGAVRVAADRSDGADRVC